MRIAEIRRDKGLTLEEFGKLVDNAGKSIVSKWEKGSTIPN
ncbi:helix-turn-helix transcriptional regulator, partial [Bacillus sp. JJ864]